MSESEVDRPQGRNESLGRQSIKNLAVEKDLAQGEGVPKVVFRHEREGSKLTRIAVARVLFGWDAGLLLPEKGLSRMAERMPPAIGFFEPRRLRIFLL